MANTDKRNGFQPITSGGRQTRRARRYVDAAVNTAATMMPGDAYILANDNVIRQTSDSGAINGIMEAVDLPGAGIAQGPTTYDYVPAATSLYIIGIEDEQAEFAVTTTEAIAAAAYDSGALVDLVDTTGNVALRQSRQAVKATGDQFKLIRPLEIYIPGYDKYAAFATVVVKLLPAGIE